MLNFPEQEDRQSLQRQFYKMLLTGICKLNLNRKLFDMFLKEYPDRDSRSVENVIYEVIRATQPTRTILEALLEYDYGHEFIIKCLLSAPKESLKTTLEFMRNGVGSNIFTKYPTFQSNFYRHIMNHGPFIAGCYCWPHRQSFVSPGPYFPWEYVVVAVRRNEKDTLEWILKNRGNEMMEIMLRECVSSNSVETLKWLSEHGLYSNALVSNLLLNGLRDLAEVLGYTEMVKLLDEWRESDERAPLNVFFNEYPK